MKKLFTFTLLLLFVAVAVFAVPARPGFRVFEQPDGTKFIAQLKGDEHFHFAETEDRYAIIRNSEGWWTYANKVDGILVPSLFLVGKDNPPFPKGLRPDPDKVASLPGNEFKQINWTKLFNINDEATKAGYTDRKFLVILGCFDDSSFLGTVKPATRWDINSWTLRSGFTSGRDGGTAHDSLYWDSVFFSNSSGSFRTFFKEISFGRWLIDTACHVQGPVSSGKVYGVYGDGAELTYMQDIIYRSSGRMKTTPHRADQNAYSDYDGDGDGYVDHWIVVRAGGEQSATGSVKDMWATKYTTTVSTTTGATVRNPTNAGELTDSLSKTWTLTQLQDTQFVRSYTMGIGVHAHESFHAFSAPDLYDYGYQGEPADVWSLMDGGSWTGDGIQSGSRPPHPGAMLQYSFRGYPESGDTTAGFMPDDWDQLITTNGRYFVVGLAADSSKGGPRFIMARNAAMTTAGEYFFIENRCNKGFFESCLPEHGLIIVHYDQSEKGTYYNDGPDYYTYWVEQRGFDPQLHVTYPNDTIYRDAGQAPYFAGDDYEFTNLTKAGANVNGSTTNFGPYIISISAPGDTMWFTIDNATVPATASFAYKSHTVYDTLTNYSNNNGTVDPDEVVDLVIAVKNVGGNASSVAAKLRHKYGLVTVLDSTANYGTINSLATVSNTGDIFRIKVKPGCPLDTILFFTLYFTSSNGSNEAEFGIKLNSTPLVYTTTLRTSVSSSLTDAAGIDLMYFPDINDWLFMAAGTGLGNFMGTGAKKMFILDLSTWGTVIKDSFVYAGANYLMCMDHDAQGRIWYASGDSAYCYDISSGSPVNVGRLRWPNSDYAGTVMKRVRGITFDNNDSLYGYWQTYGTFEESIYGVRKTLGTLSTIWDRAALLDGTSYGGKWNNGRGIEWDGTCLWSVNIFENLIFRKYPINNPSVPSNLEFKTINTISCPSVVGNYPAYDIAIQDVSSDGVTPAVPYAFGNKYYMWTMNMDNSEVTKIDVTALVLPQQVDLVTSACTFNDAKDSVTLVWKKNPLNDFVTKYIVYRSQDANFYATSKDSVLTTTDTTAKFVIPNTKGLHYFKVRAVNYQGYSFNTSDEVYVVNNTTTALNTVSLVATQKGTDVYLEWEKEGINSGSAWEVSRAKDNGQFEVVGSVDFKSTKFVDNKISENGTYTYKLDLVKLGGEKVTYGQASIKFFNPYVFKLYQLDKNPVKGSFNINYSIDREDYVTLKVYSVTGQVVATLANGVMTPGRYMAKVDENKLSAGIYYVVLTQGTKKDNIKITILK